MKEDQSRNKSSRIPYCNNETFSAGTVIKTVVIGFRKLINFVMKYLLRKYENKNADSLKRCVESTEKFYIVHVSDKNELSLAVG